jgi:hypothetical protein
MTEKLLNKYLKIDPVKFDSFISSDKESYEAVGVVLAAADGVDVPIGAKVWFDSFMAKKYPVVGQDGKYEWFIHIDEVVKIEYDA